MPTTHLNREPVERRLRRLRSEYGEFPVVEDTEELPPDVFEEFRADAREGYTGAGYAWVVRDPAEVPPLTESMPDDARETRPQVLLILNRGTEGPTWNVPGGGREGEETYEEATRREVREETGIEAAVGDPFLAYRGEYHAEGDPEAVLHLLWVCFEAAYEDGTIDVQEGELRGAAWFCDPPGDLSFWAQFRAVEWFESFDVDDPWWEQEGFDVAPGG